VNRSLICITNLPVTGGELGLFQADADVFPGRRRRPVEMPTMLSVDPSSPRTTPQICLAPALTYSGSTAVTPHLQSRSFLD
jgi:hypothetical protein